MACAWCCPVAHAGGGGWGERSAAPGGDTTLAAESARGLSIKEMKAAIGGAGLSVADIVEKSDLIERYQQACLWYKSDEFVASMTGAHSVADQAARLSGSGRQK